MSEATLASQTRRLFIGTVAFLLLGLLLYFGGNAAVFDE